MTELPADHERPAPTPGSIWRHWGGRLYLVICVAKREDDGHHLVVYEPASLTGGQAWVRDAGQWHTIVTLKDGTQLPRFTLVDGQTEDEPDE